MRSLANLFAMIALLGLPLMAAAAPICSDVMGQDVIVASDTAALHNLVGESIKVVHIYLSVAAKAEGRTEISVYGIKGFQADYRSQESLIADLRAGKIGDSVNVVKQNQNGLLVLDSKTKRYAKIATKQSSPFWQNQVVIVKP